MVFCPSDDMRGLANMREYFTKMGGAPDAGKVSAEENVSMRRQPCRQLLFVSRYEHHRLHVPVSDRPHHKPSLKNPELILIFKH